MNFPKISIIAVFFTIMSSLAIANNATDNATQAKQKNPHNTISLGYKYAVGDNYDYTIPYFKYSHKTGSHRVDLTYEYFDRYTREYQYLSRVNAGYTYLGQDVMAGGYISSASTKLFSHEKTSTLIGFAGYNVWGDVTLKQRTLPSGKISTVPYGYSLYLGVAGASQPILYGSYAFPFVAFSYIGENLFVTLGVPRSSLKYSFNSYHSTSLELLERYVIANYTFTPNNDVSTFTLSYSHDVNRFEILDDMRTNDDSKKYFVRSSWLKFKYSQQLMEDISASISVERMLEGHYYHGKNYKGAPSRRLDKATRYDVEMEYKF